MLWCAVCGKDKCTREAVLQRAVNSFLTDPQKHNITKHDGCAYLGRRELEIFLPCFGPHPITTACVGTSFQSHRRIIGYLGQAGGGNSAEEVPPEELEDPQQQGSAPDCAGTAVLKMEALGIQKSTW